MHFYVLDIRWQEAISGFRVCLDELKLLVEKFSTTVSESIVEHDYFCVEGNVESAILLQEYIYGEKCTPLLISLNENERNRKISDTTRLEFLKKQQHALESKIAKLEKVKS
jgi:hypothetical protein